MQRANWRMGAMAAALAGASGAVHGQQFVNGGFQNGSLAGWTIQMTTNGSTSVQTVAEVDIDGPGPLGPSLAAKFSVGNATTMANHQAGVDLFQMLELTAGVEYWVSFNWAATRTSGIENPEGGVFAVLADSQVLGGQSAGPTSPGSPKYGVAEGVFIPTASGPVRLGARITRPYTVVSELFQWVDNVQIVIPPQGACCLHDGSCRFVSSRTCQALDGVYRGDGAACSGANCPAPGACCLFLNCQVLSEIECGRQSGAYRGHGQSCASTACPPQGTLMPLPPQTAVSSSETLARGFWFQAPREFVITGVRVPDPAGQGVQNFEVVRLATFPPQSAASATNNFVSRVRRIGAPSATIVPVNVQVQAGDVIGILGNCGTSTMHHSSADGGLGSTIFGEAVTLLRLSMNGNLNIEPARDLYGSTAPATVIARVEIYYAEATGGCYANCDQSTTQPILNVDDFTCFINAFAQAVALPPGEQIVHYANCDGSAVAPVLNVDDFTCFINAFAAGCR